jgi:hypothetical protein
LLDVRYRLLDISRGDGVVKIGADDGDDHVGRLVHREHFLDRHHSGVSLRTIVQRLDQRGVGGLADQQPFGLDQQHDRGRCQHQADEDRRNSVEHRAAGHRRQGNPGRGNHQPGDGAPVFEQDDEVGRVLGIADRPEDGFAPARAVELPERREGRPAFERDRHPEHDEGHE